MNISRRLIYFWVFFFSFAAEADVIASCDLKNRLNQINSFYTRFIQKINISHENTIELSQGELWVKYPNLFHWHITSPEENFLISDGDTLWFYVPIIKQVTAYCLNNNNFDNILFKLLFNHDCYEWNYYDVSQKNNWFDLKPILNNIQHLKEYRIEISNCGIITQFSVIEKDGQQIDYYFFNQHHGSVSAEKFHFTISEDIQLDDQRINL